MKKNSQFILLSILSLASVLTLIRGQRAQAYDPSHLQRLKSTGNCEKCDLSGANLSNIKLTNANLRSSNLANANLTNALIIDSDLRSVDFSDAIIKNTNVYGTQIAISSLSKSQNNGLIFKKPEPAIVEKDAARSQKSSQPKKQETVISIKNSSGYRAKYTIMYMVDQTFTGGVKAPVPKILNGDVVAITNQRRAIKLPKGAKDIRLMVKTRAGKSFFINTPIAANEKTCFKLKGTVFTPKYEKNSCLGF